MKLISMVDYVLYQSSNDNLEKVIESKQMFKIVWGKIFNYAKLLKRPLTLGMFVPCDLEGNVLKEPKKYNILLGNERRNPLYGKQIEKYQQAKERVLFKGFEVEVKKQPHSYVPEETDYIKFSNTLRIRLKDIVNFSMEFLVKYELELTESAIKQLK